MAVIKELSELTEADRGSFGTKAVNLGLLTRLGLRVPAGFAVSSEVYEAVLAEVDPGATPQAPPQRYLSASDEIVEALRAGCLPKRFADEIMSRLTALGGEHFAVRSSASCEDAASLSMAGVFESCIDLELEEVPGAVIECYCSLFSDRALEAYDRAGIDPAAVGMTAVVQRFVPGSPSGVLFTADPVRGDDTRIQLSAVAGWCRDAVSGDIPKARITLDKATGDVRDAQVPDGAPRPPAGQLAELAAGARRIEAALAVPVDVEWTTAEGYPVFLQARPLTGVRSREFPVSWERPEDEAFCWQEPAGPAPPLAAELHRMEMHAGNEGAAQSGLAFFYTDVTEQNGYLYFRQLDLPDADARRTAHLERVRALAAEGKNIFTDVYLPRITELQERAAPMLELTADSSAEDLRHGLEVGADYLRRVMSFHWLVVHGALYEDTLEELRNRFGLSTSEVNDLLFTPSMLTRKRGTLMEMAGLVRSDPELSALFARHSSDLVVYHRLSRLEGGRRVLKLFERFLATYGLTRREVHLDYRIYAEAPHLIVGEVRTLLGLDSSEHAENLRRITERQSALTEGLTSHRSEDAAADLHAELDFLRKSFTVRDDHGHYIDLGAVGYLRYVLMRVAERIVRTGALRHPGGIEFLRLDEIRAAIADPADPANPADPGLAALVAERRRLLEEQRHLAAPPWIGAPPEDPPAAGDETPAAPAGADATAADSAARSAAAGDTPAPAEPHPAEVRGYSGLAARVVAPVVTVAGLDRDPPARFILVLHHTREINPAAYAGRVAGIVVEDGSPFDHIGIWARENAIPTLFSAEGITSLVTDGDVLELDGVEEVARPG